MQVRIIFQFKIDTCSCSSTIVNTVKNINSSFEDSVVNEQLRFQFRNKLVKPKMYNGN